MRPGEAIAFRAHLEVNKSELLHCASTTNLAFFLPLYPPAPLALLSLRRGKIPRLCGSLKARVSGKVGLPGTSGQRQTTRRIAGSISLLAGLWQSLWQLVLLSLLAHAS